MNALLDAINARRRVAPTNWRARVRRVAVILSGSRGGSSVVKEVLAAHPQVAALDGELEPFLVLTRNGFGANSNSDALGVLANQDALADNIFDALSVPDTAMASAAQWKTRWQHRLLLQFPLLFMDDAGMRGLGDALDEALAQFRASQYARTDESALQRMALSAVFRAQPWRINYYDGQGRAGINDAGLGPSGFFDEALKIEEPPFVLPRAYRRQFVESDTDDKVLLFKSPADAYRIGIYEQLFPSADIKYIHLSRGYAQSVNGLMDGWLSPVGFFAHDMARAGTVLRIAGYSDSTRFGTRWWKFDLPPAWRALSAASLEDVCMHQWLAAHQAIFDSAQPTLRLAFEQFTAQPAAAIAAVTGYLGLADMAVPARMPVTMATEAPRAQRWRKRERQLLALGRQAQVGAMMGRLGYTMDPEAWS
jgi:hypothetical protein